MNYLSRAEEILLLSIWRLQKNAYGMSIKSQVEEATGKNWSFGAIYAPLNRLLKKGLVSCWKGDPTPERGGRSKVYYQISKEGKESLLEIKKVNEAIWIDIPALKQE
ncbi:PadR family transcriptional regulator [candidate division KSB1 bacterium]